MSFEIGALIPFLATSTGGLTAILLSWLLPQTPTANSSVGSADGEIANI
jgi:xanthine permease XanP